MTKKDKSRILGRRLAKELSAEQLKTVAGSVTGTFAGGQNGDDDAYYVRPYDVVASVVPSTRLGFR